METRSTVEQKDLNKLIGRLKIMLIKHLLYVIVSAVILDNPYNH